MMKVLAQVHRRRKNLARENDLLAWSIYTYRWRLTNESKGMETLWPLCRKHVAEGKMAF